VQAVERYAGIAFHAIAGRRTDMNKWLLIPAFILSLAIAACSGGDLGIDDSDSRIVIVNDVGGAIVSTPDSRGSIDMVVGGQRQFTIRRTVTVEDASPVVTDVTADADFNFTNPAVAAMDASGQLTALATGFTTLEVVYRDDDGDPSDDDKVSLDITVTSIL
jgi:hypothetical protein